MFLLCFAGWIVAHFPAAFSYSRLPASYSYSKLYGVQQTVRSHGELFAFLVFKYGANLVFGI